LVNFNESQLEKVVNSEKKISLSFPINIIPVSDETNLETSKKLRENFFGQKTDVTIKYDGSLSIKNQI